LFELVDAELEHRGVKAPALKAGAVDPVAKQSKGFVELPNSELGDRLEELQEVFKVLVKLGIAIREEH